MKKYLLSFILFLTISITYSQSYYYLSGIEVTPSTPTTQDSVYITIKGSLSTTGSYMTGITPIISSTDINIIIDLASGPGFTALVPFDTTIVLSPLSVNTYTVFPSGLHLYNDMPDTVSFQVIGSANAYALQSNVDIRISPNPTTNYFDIQTTIPISEIVRIELFDINGRLLQNFQPNGSFNFQLENDYKGLSFIAIQTQKGIVLKKLFIE